MKLRVLFLTSIVFLLPGGRTNIADGIQIAREQVFSAARRGANKILILITDGEPNERVNDTQREADLAKRDRISIVSVGRSKIYIMILPISL